MNIYRGKHRKKFAVREDKRGVTTTVYRRTKTVVTTVDLDGNVETSVEPP